MTHSIRVTQAVMATFGCVALLFLCVAISAQPRSGRGKVSLTRGDADANTTAHAYNERGSFQDASITGRLRTGSTQTSTIVTKDHLHRDVPSLLSSAFQQPNKTVVVTGCAGFIGMHVSQALLARGDRVIGVDNINSYYDPKLKLSRLARLEAHDGFTFAKLDIRDRQALPALFHLHTPDGVVHLAAQAGVRHSLNHPEDYVDNNLVGFGNVLEAARHAPSVKHLVYASSSSVYGGNVKIPFSESDPVNRPINLYAASKRANELMAHSYSHLFGLPTTGLRFFTVYGPWGRPDMSLYIFIRSILAGEPIRVYNHGRMKRDFTYIDDIVQGIVRVLDKPARPDVNVDARAPSPPLDRSATAPFRIFNIGNGRPVPLQTYVSAIERAAGKKAIQLMEPMQAGDAPASHADTNALQAWVGFHPDTDIHVGIENCVEWFREYYRLNT